MTDPNTIKKILELREQKLRYSDIAAELGITKDTARYYCKAHGLGSLVKTTSPMFSEEEGALVADMYLNKGMTPSEIAIKLGRSPVGIRKYLLRHGIKKSRSYTTPKVNNIDKTQLPKPIEDPIYYPEKTITPKKVQINGKSYTDISEVYGL